MRSARLGLLALCLAQVLGGCTSANPATSERPLPAQPGAARPSWWREAPDSARSGVYVVQADGRGDGVVFGYGQHDRSNKAPRCSIGGQTFEESQIATDRTGNLYLPNSTTGAVGVYAPHCGALLKTIADPQGGDLDVAIDGSRIYALGFSHVSVCSMNGCSRELTDGSILQLESAAVDHSGNVWATYYNQNGAPSLIVWAGAQMPGRIVNGYVNQNTPGGLTFDRHDTLVSIQSRFMHVYVYRCDAGTASCVNTETVTLQADSIFGALDAKNTNYQVTDYANDSVDVYAYPSFNYQYSYSRGLFPNYTVEGIAQAK